MTDLPDITDAQVIDAIRAVVAENPEKVYARPEHMEAGCYGACYYVHVDQDGENPTPGCVIGVALHRLGVPLEMLRECEGENAWALVGSALPHISDETRSFANTVQGYQDGGTPWGDALRYAEGRRK